MGIKRNLDLGLRKLRDVTRRKGERAELKPGDPAPDFTLPDHRGNPVPLAELRGSWVVLWFYPAADTPG